MSMTIEPYTSDHVSEVVAFNQRLQEAGLPFRFSESPVPPWLPRTRSNQLFQEYFVVRDEEGTVRGAYILKHQPFTMHGEEVFIGAYQYPVSEGLRNGQYAIAGLLTLKDALRRQPLLFGLGMGGYHEPVARLLKNMRFRMVQCPFLFRINHPYRFLRGIQFLRNRPGRRILLDLAALSGLGWMVAKLTHALLTRDGSIAGVEIERLPVFDARVDEIWAKAKSAYALIAVRNREMLDILYPREKEKFIRLLLTRHGKPFGWVVLLNTQMDGHRQFGNLRVGSVVDCLAIPGKESAAARAATDHLSREVDLMVTNQLDERWRTAFGRQGYLQGPSNYIFAVSPQLAGRLEPFEMNARRTHITRGDGDGPIHL